MERIRQALDRAREQRSSRPHPIDGIAGRLFENPAPAPERVPSAFVYDKTQVFYPAPAALEKQRVVNPAIQHAASNAFRMLRTQVLQRMNEHGWRTLAILSASEDEGKTTTAINLAVNLACDQRHTVLLVDCDLRRPGIAKRLGIRATVGVDDVLTGRATVEQCLFHPDGFDRFVVMPARASMPNSSEALAGPAARDLVADLRGRYAERIVVFDLPPVLGSDDALSFLPLVECGLVVAAEGTTRREDLIRCLELVRKTPIVGTVLNLASSVPATYG